MPRNASKRMAVREEAQRFLAGAGRPLHYSEIAQHVLARLALQEPMSPKDVNTCLPR